MLADLPQLSAGILGLLIGAGLLAGWVDAVVGGGGLIQLPAMLLVPGLTPVQALATNKLGSIMGTVTSSVTYARRVKPQWRTVLPMALCAFAGSIGGAAVATHLPQSVFKPIIVVALILVALFTAFHRGLGSRTQDRFRAGAHTVIATLLGAVIGFYDGMIGPGTGSFLVIALVSVLGYSFLSASATAKMVNVATNLGALALFVPHGAVVYSYGLILGASNMLGGYLGSRMAISRGNAFIRIVFLVVVFALIVKLGADVLLGH